MMGEKMGLPPGFEFDPSDEELILHFLCPRAANLPCYPNIIPDLHTNCAPNPWDLNGKAFRSKNEWYFFSGYTMTMRNGFWKEVGVSGPIFSSNGSGLQIGIKYHLVFHSDGIHETNWLMDEYHLLNYNNTSTSQIRPDLNEWVLCRVHEANNSFVDDDSGDELSYLDEAFIYLEEEQNENYQEEISTFPTYTN